MIARLMYMKQNMLYGHEMMTKLLGIQFEISFFPENKQAYSVSSFHGAHATVNWQYGETLVEYSSVV